MRTEEGGEEEVLEEQEGQNQKVSLKLSWEEVVTESWSRGGVAELSSREGGRGGG